MPPITVDVWSDIACPWCYVGKRRLEAALELFDGEVAVNWRSFELAPNAPRVTPAEPYARRLAAKYGMSLQQGEAMVATMTSAGAEAGLELRFDRVRPGNTFDAHRLIHLGTELGRADAVKERLFRAYLTEGETIGERETLARLAEEAGLPAERVEALLEGDEFAGAVRADEGEAQRLRIQGVPHLRLASGASLSGAQAPEVILEALRSA